ncbi:hypothetical protein Ciccas_004216 [Cichlidogyrus casuarinus]|uniref:G-protein coupled receptors family 1 profile domain-containing protein n=1 Tax=Cichlidogyrus casuarinus TaxID=1844966 RepID=A0ABD2QC57_9PLAT
MNCTVTYPREDYQNGSMFQYINACYPSKQNYQDNLIKTCAISFFVLIPGILGNIFLIIIVKRTRSLHSATNYYLVNLAVIDLSIALGNALPYLIYELELLQTLSNILGFLVCPFNSFTQSKSQLNFHLIASSVTSVSGNTLTLTMIAVDRYFGIMHPLKSYITDRRASHFILLIWMISSALAFPIFFYSSWKFRIWNNRIEFFCSGNIHPRFDLRYSSRISSDSFQ